MWQPSAWSFCVLCARPVATQCVARLVNRQEDAILLDAHRCVLGRRFEQFAACGCYPCRRRMPFCWTHTAAWATGGPRSAKSLAIGEGPTFPLF